MSILVNGSPIEGFLMERGLRQGDSLSPFLFVLIVCVLNTMVQEAVNKWCFKGVFVGCDDINISHLQYAHHTIFLVNGEEEMCAT